MSIGWSSTRSNSARVSGPGLSQIEFGIAGRAELVHQRGPAEGRDLGVGEPEPLGGVGGELARNVGCGRPCTATSGR